MRQVASSCNRSTGHNGTTLRQSRCLRGPVRRAMDVRASGTDTLAAWIEDNLDGGKVTKSSFNGGSSWSSTYVYETAKGKKYFVKTALRHDAEAMFKGEALGLQALHATNTVRIPEVFHQGPMPDRPVSRGGSFIVMEFLSLSGRVDQAELGRLLALMHLAEPLHDEAKQGKFGFPVDNTIGGTPQPNPWADSWVDFFREHRLLHQLRLAGDSDLMRMGEKLAANLEQLFEGVEVRPSVLHGDLWSGNLAGVHGKPAIFDPATYYGHHEAEFGMSWCAGFGDAFYRAYHEVIPRAPGFEERKKLYLLYHYLNHYNLFGSSYYNQSLSLLQALTGNL